MYYGRENPSAIRQDASAVSDTCCRPRERCRDTRSPLYVEILGELAGRCGKINLNVLQRKRMNAKFLFFSDIRLFNKIISAVFRRIC